MFLITYTESKCTGVTSTSADENVGSVPTETPAKTSAIEGTPSAAPRNSCEL